VPSAGPALAAAPVPLGRLVTRRGLKLAAIIGGIALCGLAVLVYVGLRIGPLALGIGVAGAILPVPLLVLCFLWLDRYEPEPLRYLVFCFAWGAGVATGLSLLVNTVSMEAFKDWHISATLVPVVVAPLGEESTKAAGPLLLFIMRRKTFSGMIDGIVYCGLSATGFAMVENILYLGGHGYAKGAQEGGPWFGAANVVAIFFIRIVMSGFAHPLFTAMTGIGLGLAIRAKSRALRILAPVIGLLLAMVLHGSWNLVPWLSSTLGDPYVMLYWYVAVMMPLFFVMVGFTLWLRSSEGRLAERVLWVYVAAGWMSPPEVMALGTLGRRLAARQWAKRVAGETGAKAMRAYQFEATRLAMLRDRMRRGVALTPDVLPETLAEERRLLETLAAHRQVFTGRDSATPRAFWDGGRYHVAFPDGVVRVLAAAEQPVVPVPARLVQMAPPAYPPYPGYPGYPGYPYYR
jgi:RsiW-degrading membrane proteinase PrsW (M82 family)